MYLVKVTYTAKDNNPNFKGEVEVCYCGKDNHSTNDPSKYFKDNYGYARKSDALRNFHFKYADDEIFWGKKVEVVEVA